MVPWQVGALSSQIEISGGPKSAQRAPKTSERNIEIVWRNVVVFIGLHVLALQAILNIVAGTKIALLFYALLINFPMGLGITAGAHRLWAHRSYKAKTPLKIILLVMQTCCFQNSVYTWVRDHRLHHKFTDTEADPHNSTRGFFFSHMGWLMVRKAREVREKGKCLNMEDITSDSLLMFQHRHYFPLMLLCTLVFPSCLFRLMREDWYACVSLACLRYLYMVHSTWLVNSAAHIYGTKPYDKHIKPSENKFVSFMTAGEGWHNYHHVFPWDYKAAELPTYGLNGTLFVLNCFARIGWAYDLKTADPAVVGRKARRTGDGSRKNVWGWGDDDMDDADYEAMKVVAF